MLTVLNVMLLKYFTAHQWMGTCTCYCME